MSGEIIDELPEDLNAVDVVRAQKFPDNSRRRIPAVLYAVVAAGAVAARTVAGSGSAVANDGLWFAAAVLGAAAVMSLTSGWRMTVDEKEALVLGMARAGFSGGHASAQQVWRGLRSRPTWRILCYSAEEPPARRGLVLVDAVDGRVLEVLVEANPDLESPAAAGQ